MREGMKARRKLKKLNRTLKEREKKVKTEKESKSEDKNGGESCILTILIFEVIEFPSQDSGMSESPLTPPPSIFITRERIKIRVFFHFSFTFFTFLFDIWAE